MADSSSPLPDSILLAIPPDEASQAALKLAQKSLPRPIFNHSLRVYLISRWLAEQEANAWISADRLPLLFVAAVCHDLGASDLYNGQQRFEVEGADAAKAHLISHGASAENSHNVWTAIAVHTSPGIAERIHPLSRLIRLGVLVDFSSEKRTQMEADDFCANLERELPRLDVEKTLGDAVIKQAGKIEDVFDKMSWPSSEKHPSASWPGILLRAHVENPDWDGVNPAF